MLQTGSSVLDRLLGGTYPEKTLTLMYGPAASGKTTCCLLASLQAISAGKKVVYIDTEGGFSAERLAQLSGYMPEFKDILIEDVMSNIFLFAPKDLMEQGANIQLTEKIVESTDIGLIAIDTVGAHYRRILRRNPKGVNNTMGRQLDILRAISKEHPLAILLTNQIYQNPDGGEIVAVGGKMMVQRSKCLIELTKNEHLRRAILKKHPEREPNTIGTAFEITDKGIQPRERFTAV